MVFQDMVTSITASRGMVHTAADLLDQVPRKHAYVHGGGGRHEGG
jgi:hypothetical protein